MKNSLFLLGLAAVTLTIIGAGCAPEPVIEETVTPKAVIDDRGFHVVIAGLTFDLPVGWQVYSVGEMSVTILVPDPQYIVRLPFSVEEVAVDLSTHGLLQTTSAGAEIYKEVCAPGSCSYISYKGKTYLATFGPPESDEPVPENQDGSVWFPSTSVTHEEKMEFLATVH